MGKLSPIYGLLLILLAFPCKVSAQDHDPGVHFKVFVTDVDEGRPLDGIIFGKKGVAVWESESTYRGVTKIRIKDRTIRNIKTPTSVELFLLPDVLANQPWEMLDNGRVPVCDYNDPDAYSSVYLRRKRNNQQPRPSPIEDTKLDRVDGSKEEVIRRSIMIGTVQYVNRDYLKAIETFKSALVQDPDNHIILHLLGKTLAQAGMYKDAQGIFDKCAKIREDPQRAIPLELVETLESYASLLWRMDMKVDAEAMQERANMIRRNLKQSTQ